MDTDNFRLSLERLLALYAQQRAAALNVVGA